MAYCTPSDVARVLGLGYSFTSSTTPTEREVESFIEEAEDEIDHRTHHSWKEATVTDEFYDLPGAPGVRYKLVWNGIRIDLRHREIKTIDTSEGDKIEIWTGNSYEDWVTAKTSGRNNDWWLDYEQGVLWLRRTWTQFLQKGLRMTYRYGDSKVPNDIRKACALLCAMDLVSNDDRSVALPETGDPTRLTHDERLSRWRKKVDHILMNRTEWAVF